MNSTLVALYSKIESFLPFSKKREKGCSFTTFIYILNMLYTFKLKSAFRIQKCALKNNKSAFSYFQHLSPLSKRETKSYSQIQKFSCDLFRVLLTCTSEVHAWHPKLVLKKQVGFRQTDADNSFCGHYLTLDNFSFPATRDVSDKTANNEIFKNNRCSTLISRKKIRRQRAVRIY